jgi:N-acyl-D-aspartate/D-glutamate deacylase
VVSEFDGIYATHQRSESNEIFSSLDEIFRIAREGHLRAEISHLKLSGSGKLGEGGRGPRSDRKSESRGFGYHAGSICVHGFEHGVVAH